MFAIFQFSEQFAPGVYDNSDLPLTDLERHILELRSKDRNEEIVGETGTLIKSPDVGFMSRLAGSVIVMQVEIDDDICRLVCQNVFSAAIACMMR